jgi:hypothetical protein
MFDSSQYDWYNQQPTEPEADVMLCDARVQGGMMTLCEFAGHQYDPDRRRRCKNFKKATWRSNCMHYREDIVGACDYVEVTK